ncbi:MAG: hotdog fold domain-containing protein [Moraxellaceae bacterium]
MPPVLSLFEKCRRMPAGRFIFSRALCLKAPYFSSIRPVVMELRPGLCEVRMRKRRAVTNHIGTVHAIAMCNMAELSGGLLTDVSLPAGMRWIPKGMTVEYLKKAETDLLAKATLESQPASGFTGECPALVEVRDTTGDLVFRACIIMWVSPQK